MVCHTSLVVLAALLLHAVCAKQCDNNTYDYIVVGSGPGGSPVATNLARAGHSVLLLEAGTDQSADISTQILAIGQQEATNTWDFYVKLYSNETQALRNNHLTWQRADGSLWVGNGTAPPADVHLLGVYYPRGATLGGSSVINAGVTVLPAESYWDSIATLTGDRSWNAKSIRQIFEHIEDNHYLRPGTPGHGFNGYLDTNGNDGSPWTHNPGILEVLKSMVATTGGDANQTLSLVQRDINSVSPNRDTTQGLFGLPFHANKKWRRFGARDLALATLSATKEDGTPRYPLTLQTNSLATRILFDQTHGKRPEAIGIEYLHGQSLYNGDRRSSLNITGTVRQAHARKEVIISGGVFNSPQLLLLSGIGPKEDLAKLNIPVLVDLPGVGKRLQENQELPIVGHTKQPNIATPFPGDPDCTFGAPGDPCVAAWQNGTGPYARSGINTNAFMLKSNHTPDGELDLLLFAIPFPFRGYWRADANVTIPPDPPTVFDLSMVHIKAQNRAGELKLRSNNPRDTPDINFHFFEEGSETDLGAMADAVAWGRRVYANVAAPYGPVEPTEPPLVGNTGEQVAADYQWIKDQAFGHHASGTCGIGADDDELAVLDSMFRVRGVDGLRVVDGSAFPSPPGAFPVVPTYLISEKASRDILGST